MKNIILILMPLVLLLGCTGGYNIQVGIGKLSEINERYFEEDDWGPSPDLAGQGLAELQEFEQELLGYEGDNNAGAMLQVILGMEKVYEAKIALGEYDGYEPGDAFCSIAGDIILSYQSAANDLSEAAGIFSDAASIYSSNYGEEFSGMVSEIASTYAGISDLVQAQVIPQFQTLRSRNC